jgi:hypothetical protein
MYFRTKHADGKASWCAIWHRLDSTNQNDKMQHFVAISKKNGPKWQKNCKICYSLARVFVLFGRHHWRDYWHFCFILRRWGVNKTARTTRGQYARHPNYSSHHHRDYHPPSLRHNIIQPSSRDDGHVSGNKASCVAIEWCDWNWNLIYLLPFLVISNNDVNTRCFVCLMEHRIALFST